MGRFDGQVAVVTGTGSRLGAAGLLAADADPVGGGNDMVRRAGTAPQRRAGAGNTAITDRAGYGTR